MRVIGSWGIFLICLLAGFSAHAETRTVPEKSMVSEPAVDETFDDFYDFILLGETPEESVSENITNTEPEVLVTSPAPDTISAPSTPADKALFDRLESLGILSNLREGAMEKSIWKGQKRSDIYNAIASLPARHGMISAQQLKRNLLLSQTDTHLIENNIELVAGKDLLDLRLQKLVEMGESHEPLELYRAIGGDPYHENLARTGILLVLYHGDFATACLEEKVLAPRYPGSRFWMLLDQSCQITLGMLSVDKADFSDSKVLETLFKNPGFMVRADDSVTLSGLSALERGIVAAQGRIDFSPLSKNPATIKDLRSDMLALFINTTSLPEGLLFPLQTEAFARGLMTLPEMRKADPDYKRIFEMETLAEQWTAMSQKLSTESSPARLRHYGALLKLSRPDDISHPLLMRIFAIFLLSGERIPDFWMQKLEDDAAKNPENYVYLQGIKSLGIADTPPEVAAESLKSGLLALPGDQAIHALSLIEVLDSTLETDHNPLKVYEKELGLTLNIDYVMPRVDLLETLNTALAKQHTGIVVLSSLEILQGNAGTTHPDVLKQVLGSLKSVGLIEETKKMSQEWLASLLTQTKKGE